MRILIHARLRDMFRVIKTSLEAQQHQVDGAFSVEEGRGMMINSSYDKVFIGIGVPNHDRQVLMSLAGELGMSMVEIIDANTVTKELLMHSPTGKHPCLPPPTS